ncbi:ABC transporter permease [Ningiella sp. W23]|uniref:ABC transporter permease n=1 Tax=Ningiella sp. W23 TaxID=3023715 RepID=UPI00375665AC
METFISDMKFGLRNLRSKPLYTFIALLTLSIGIGATTAMYTLVNNVLLQPLPFPNSNELVLVQTVNKKTGAVNRSFSIDFYERLKASPSQLRQLVFYAYDQATLEIAEQQKPLTLMLTSNNFMQTIGVQPLLGRWYSKNDINQQSVLISYDVWQGELKGVENVLSKTIRLNKQEFSIIGVMPKGFSTLGYASAAFWMPIDKLERPVNLAGRLESGITIDQAKRQSGAWQRIVDNTSEDSQSVFEIDYVSVLDELVKDSRPALYLLLASVIAVFLIAVLNVVNLSFAQFSNRTQELAVRVSVGATRTRLLRQLLSESSLLCFIGGALGLLLAAWAIEGIQAMMGSRLPRSYEVGLDANALIAVVILITLATIATSIIPGYSIANPKKLAEAIKQAGRKATSDKQSQQVRRFLVSGEVAIAVVLLIFTGLLLKSYTLLSQQDTGFNSEGIVTGHVWLADNYEPKPTRPAYWLRLVEELKNIPSVISVAATSTMPMGRTGIDFPVSYSYPQAPAVPRGEEPKAAVRTITPDYFELLEVDIIEGREFDMRDTPDSAPVVVINERLAKEAWPNESAVGKTLTVPDWMGGRKLIVGVVGNVKHRGLRAQVQNEFFLPVTQLHYPGMSFLVKTQSKDFNQIKNMMLQSAIELETTAPMILLESLEALTKDSIVSERIMLNIMGIFAALALCLASIGVYGISDNMVSQRINEIGIRMAIGANASQIRKWIILDTIKPVAVGAIAGLICALIGGRLLASSLYGAKPWDFVTFASIPLILIIVGFIATWLPTRKATRVHPQIALQYD